MRIAAATVEDYLAAVPDHQRPLVSRLRDTVRAAVQRMKVSEFLAVYEASIPPSARKAAAKRAK